MKQLGYLDNGKVLVECSADEIKAFHHLATVAQGKAVEVWSPAMNHLDADVAEALNAVAEWVELQNRANQLRYLAGLIDEAIKRPVSAAHDLAEAKQDAI